MLLKISNFIFFSLILASCGTYKNNISLQNTPMIGNLGARTEIIVFSDFQCHFCKKAAITLKKLTKSYPNRIKVYFKHFPLKKHKNAIEAAKAAEAARLQNKFWEMHDMLFAYSPDLSKETILKIANKLDLNIDKFMEDFNSDDTLKNIQNDKNEGEKLGINGTPYLFINKKQFHGSSSDLKNHI